MDEIKVIAWFVFVVFLLSVFAGEKIATGFAALVLLSMVVLNAGKVSEWIKSTI